MNLREAIAHELALMDFVYVAAGTEVGNRILERELQQLSEEYSPAVVHELAEREAGSHASGKAKLAEGTPCPLAFTKPDPRSVSVVCRLCHGDLDPDLFCVLCGVVTLP
jgi:hypothetical protein